MSLSTCQGLFLGHVSLGQLNIANPQLATNRVPGWDALYPQDQQPRIGAGVKDSPYLFPEIGVFKLLAGKVVCPGKPIFQQKAWPTRALQALRLEIGRELVLRVRFDRNELPDTDVFNSPAVEGNGKRTVTGMRLGRVQRQQDIG